MFNNAAVASKYDMRGVDQHIIDPKTGYKGPLSSAPLETVEAMVARKSNLAEVKAPAAPAAKAEKA